MVLAGLIILRLGFADMLVLYANEGLYGLMEGLY